MKNHVFGAVPPTFVVATVVAIGAIFVFTHGTMAPRMTAVATDEAVMPMSMARKRWDITTPLAWSIKKKKK